jgi:hypothetical protein
LLEYSLSILTTSAPVSDFSLNVGDTVSDMVVGLQRIAARRAASRSAAQASASSQLASGIDGFGGEMAIPSLSSGFAFVAWSS